MIGLRCPTCGLMQLPGPACKSCGTPLPAPGPPPGAREAGAPGPPPAEPTRAAGPGPVRQLTFHGAGGSLFGIHIVNLCLTLVTLGIYAFWGRVRVRKYLLSQTAFEGDRFAYHGTGGELLVGWLKAAVMFGIPVAALNVAPEFLGAPVAVRILAGLLVYGIVLVFIPVAMVGARRYRLSRTSWRGIRFSFRGRTSHFIRLFVKGSLLTLVTLGLYYPVFEVQRYAFLVSHSYFGNQKFDFQGSGRDLFGSYLLALVLTPLTLGLYWFWFLARKQRYLWDRTALATARFRFAVTGGRLLGLKLGNLVLLVVTLGLAWPWVVTRNLRFAFQHLTLEGGLDLAGIQQEAQLATATGEALSGFLDSGALDFDIG